MPAHLGQAVEIARELDIALVVTGTTITVTPGIDLDAETARSVRRHARATRTRRPDRAHVIFLTSGSTGRPKGVVLSHYASWMRAVPLGGATRLVAPGGGGDLCPFPLFHMAGWNAVLSAWALLRPIHLVSQPTGERLLGQADLWRPATLYCIPALWRRVFDAMTGPSHDLSSLRYAITGTSLVSEDLLREIKDRLPGHRDHHQLRLDGNGNRHDPRGSRPLSQERQYRSTQSGLRRRHHRRRALPVG